MGPVRDARCYDARAMHSTPRKTLPACALAAFRALLAKQSGVLEKKEAGVKDGHDIEDLHDFRVAVRRIRALVGQLKSVLPKELYARWRAEFAWLGQVTGRPRDLDVQLSKLVEYFHATGGRDEVVLASVLACVEDHRRVARAQMLADLDSPRYVALMAEVRAFLEVREAADTPGAASGGSLALARRRISKIWKKFVHKARRLSPETPDAELHQLRILGKKLRYLLEFFQDLFPPLAVDSLVAALKKCQDVLGEIQDCVVHSAHLEALATELWDSGRADRDSLLALGRMLQHLHTRRLLLRDQFPETVAEVLEQDLRLELILEDQAA